MQQQPQFASTYEERAAAVMQASVYQAVAIGAPSPDAILAVLEAAWKHRKIPLNPHTVGDALKKLQARGYVAESIMGLNALAGPRLIVDYDRGVALPEKKS